MTNIDFEFAFKTLWGLATAAGWFWVNGISGRLKEAEKDRAALQREIHDVKLAYSAGSSGQSAKRDGRFESFRKQDG